MENNSFSRSSKMSIRAHTLSQFLIILLINIHPALSQPTEYLFGGSGADRGIDIIQVTDGLMLVGSITLPNKKEDILIVHTSADGQERWRKSYGASGSDNAWSIIEHTGGYLIYGFSDSKDAKMQAMLLKINNKGDSLWTKYYGSNAETLGWSIRKTSNEKLVALAQVKSSTKPDIQIMGLSPEGELEWDLTLGQPDKSNRAFYLDQFEDDTFLLTGLSANHEKKDDDVYIARISGAGKLIWEKTIDLGALELGHSGVVSGKNCYLFGYTKLESDVHKPLLIKLNDKGKLKWSKVLHEIDGDLRILHGVPLKSGMLMTGYHRLPSTNHFDAVVIKTNKNGELVWMKNYGGPLHDSGYTIRVNPKQDQFYLIGHKMRGEGNTDMMLLIDSLPQQHNRPSGD